MPAAALVLLSMPFGLEAWPLMALGAGCDLLLWIAATVASWPGSSLLVPAPPAWALPIAALAILAIGLVPGWWRLAGILPILAGLGAGYLAATPSLLVAHNGDLVGFRAPDGELILSRSRGAEIARETWLRREARNWAGDIDRLRAGTGWLDCMVDHCRWRGGVELSVVLDGDLRSSAPCRSAALVIVARGRDLAGCGHVTRVMDQDDLAATGAIALYTQGDDITFETGTEATGLRPWTVPGRPQVAVFQ
jgi:competence protein ComEC